MLFSMSTGLSVVFAGTPANAADTLVSLYSAGVDIRGVMSRKDSIVGREKTLTPSPVSKVAEELGLPLLKTNSVDESTISWLRALGADLGVVVAYGSIFSREVLQVPRLGWINLHYSLLPEFPGAAPVQHALLNGKSKTGVTVFRLDEGIDSGPIVAQTETVVDEKENAGELLSRLSAMGALLLADVIVQGEGRITEALPQRSNLLEYASKPTRALARLDFNAGAEQIVNKVRAMNPEPMAWFEIDGNPVRILKARTADIANQERSFASIVGKDLVVGCNGRAVVLEVVQPAGKKEMPGADWFRGLRVDKVMLS